jgi:hypothetical protein
MNLTGSNERGSGSPGCPWHKPHCAARHCGLKPKSRRGGVLVAVLVVLMVIGLLVAQAARMMTVSMQGERSRAQQEQLRELLELGQWRLRQQLAGNPDYVGERLTVAVPAQELEFAQQGQELGVQSRARQARLVIEPLREPPLTERQTSLSPLSWRISVRYPVNSPEEALATWESK